MEGRWQHWLFVFFYSQTFSEFSSGHAKRISSRYTSIVTVLQSFTSPLFTLPRNLLSMRSSIHQMLLALAVMSIVFIQAVGVARAADSRLYELRVYSSAEGKQSEVIDLISNAGVKFMAKHEIRLEAAWVPVDSADVRVITLVSHADKASSDAAWAAFQKDSEWQSALEQASKNGKAVKSFERVFLSTNDYSPLLKASQVGNRVFELRTYAATLGNLAALNNRFRNHTIELFAKHGMTNLVYWSVSPEVPADFAKVVSTLAPPASPSAAIDPKSTAADSTLVYLLAHASTDAAKASFDAFRLDPNWVTARKASEAAAGGSLTVKDGVKSLFLKPLDFSPLK
jgi:hypothetical protein